MRYNELLDVLQNLIKFKPSQQAIADVIGVRQTTISGRAQRNSEFSDDEIELIEEHYGISIRGVSGADFVELDYYPDVFGSCGGGAFALSEQKELIQVPRKLFSEFSKVKAYSVINAYGDSMQPEIKNGDKLIVEHWEGEQIKDNQVYVFCYKDEIFVKRLIKNIDQVVIKSDNEIYPMRFIEKDDLKSLLVVGRIVGLMRDMNL